MRVEHFEDEFTITNRRRGSFRISVEGQIEYNDFTEEMDMSINDLRVVSDCGLDFMETDDEVFYKEIINTIMERNK